MQYIADHDWILKKLKQFLASTNDGKNYKIGENIYLCYC